MWYINLCGPMWPTVQWIQPPPYKIYEGGEHGLEWTWLDPNGEVEARIMCKAGSHQYARTPRRTATSVRFLS